MDDKDIKIKDKYYCYTRYVGRGVTMFDRVMGINTGYVKFSYLYHTDENHIQHINQFFTNIIRLNKDFHIYMDEISDFVES